MKRIHPQKINIFTKDDFKINDNVYSGIHKHMFTEIHIVAEGQISLTIENEHYILEENDAILIPANILHMVKTTKKPLRHLTFMSDRVCDEVMVKTFSHNFISEFFEAVESGESENHIYNYMFFVQNNIYPINSFETDQTINYSMLISEFFSRNYYNDVHISDFAKELHVSSTHAQRLIQQHTGKTFGENLRIQRMITADVLMQSTNMTLQEISTYVGYNSYSGFYKAYKKFKSMPDGVACL